MLFVYSKFKKKKWLKLGPEKRLKVLIALEKKIARKLKIEPFFFFMDIIISTAFSFE